MTWNGFTISFANVFEVVLEYATVLPPHAISQIEPNIPLEVYALAQYQVGIPVVIKPLFLIPILESIYR